MRFGSGSITKKIANVGEGSAGNRKLPIQNGSHVPPSGNFTHQQVTSTEITVNEAGFVLQDCERRRFGPYPLMNSHAEIRVYPVFELFRCEAQIDEARHGIGAFQQRRSHGWSGSEPSGFRESVARDGRQSLARGEGGLRSGFGIASVAQIAEGYAVHEAHQDERAEILHPIRFGVNYFRNRHGPAYQTHEVDLFLANRR